MQLPGMDWNGTMMRFKFCRPAAGGLTHRPSAPPAWPVLGRAAALRATGPECKRADD